MTRLAGFRYPRVAGFGRPPRVRLWPVWKDQVTRNQSLRTIQVEDIYGFGSGLFGNVLLAFGAVNLEETSSRDAIAPERLG